MRCQECDADLLEGDKFCDKCGTELQKPECSQSAGEGSITGIDLMVLWNISHRLEKLMSSKI